MRKLYILLHKGNLLTLPLFNVHLAEKLPGVFLGRIIRNTEGAGAEGRDKP